MKKKVLYFEGAGWSGADISKSTVGNCRIRTAFHLDDGRPVYLEIIASERTEYFSKELYQWQYTGFVDACFYITDDKPNDDCNIHRIVSPVRCFEYSEDGILAYVNSLGASFDTIKVLPDLGGYRVFPSKKVAQGPEGYNYGDEFCYDPDMIARRKAVYDEVYRIEKEERLADLATKGHKFVHHSGVSGSVYPNFSLWVDEFDPGQLHLLRHFKGYNRHWTIRTDVGDTLEEWMASVLDTTLGRYGC